ncbi:hypothetical protein CMUS01_13268 [Colletotrichum musicola]|uniref:Uncharacterized protein n=1 Tax=Colletotrichum musicola TaxID=2175873 RepID=A0A8H6MW84_9PEZI|nr:hypothetical protein CMUS01_13268 [Colletotrichum musicola]
MTGFAMVSYSGISMQYEPRPAAPRMLFNFYWFPNAFGWECPSCPAHIQHGWFVELGGVIYAGPRPAFDPVEYMQQAADDMKMPSAIYGCVPSKTGDHRPVLDKCESSFFTTLAKKKICPFPQGTDEVMEAMDEHDRDLVRLRLYLTASIFLTITAVYDLWCSKAFIAYLNTIEKDLPDGLFMTARLGKPFLLISWGNVTLLVLATAMIYNRWKMGENGFSRDGEISLDGVGGAETEPLTSGAGHEDFAPQYFDSDDADDVLPGPDRTG